MALCTTEPKMTTTCSQPEDFIFRWRISWISSSSYKVNRCLARYSPRATTTSQPSILAAVKATKTRLHDHTFLFQGAGEAAIGIAQLIAMAMHKREGVPLDQARQNFETFIELK